MNKNKFFIIVFLLLFFSCYSGRPSIDRAVSLSPSLILKEKINNYLNSPELDPVITGIKIINLKNGEVIFQANSKKLLHPASTNKLFTSAASFYYLKPDFKFRTKIYIDGLITEKKLFGNLYIKGDGDPDLKTEHLKKLAEIVYSRIKKIDGDIIADETLFDNLRKSTGWMWDDGPFQWWPPISALTINDNCIKIHILPGGHIGDPVKFYLEPETKYFKIINRSVTGNQNTLSVERKWMTHENTIEIKGSYPLNSPELVEIRTVEEPALYVAQLFREILEKKGVIIRGSVKSGRIPIDGKLLGFYESKPLKSSIKNFLKTSDNLTGEMLVKKMSSEINHIQGTTEDGVSLVKKFLSTEVGLDTTAFNYADGSGVSRYNLVSVSIEIDLLKYIYGHKNLYNLFLECLPAGGIDLREDSFSESVKGKVFAKPGSITGVSSLAGYVKSRDNEVYAFSIIMSGFVKSSLIYQNIQNKIVELIVNFSRNKLTG